MSNELEVFNKNAFQKTEERVAEMRDQGEIDLPANYSVSNALKSAFLTIQNTTDKNKNPVLKSCSKSSVMNAMLDTIIQGLQPSREQVYYVPFGKKLVAMRSYHGDVHLARQTANVKDVKPNLIYEGDELAVTTEEGRTIIENHEQSWENMKDGNIVAAYAVVEFEDDRPNQYTIMRKEEIERAWAMRRGNDKSKAHKNFAGEMAKKTVVHRACKPLINNRDDSHLFKAAKDRADLEQAKQERDEQQAETETVEVEAEEVENEKETESNKDDGSGQKELVSDEETDLEKQKSGENGRDF